VVLAGGVTVLVWREIGRAYAGRPALVAARVALVLFAEATLVSGFLRSVLPTPHLADTTFATAATHLEAFTVVMALVAEMLRARTVEGRVGRTTWAGLLLAGLGVHLLVVAHLTLGASGFARYVPIAASEPWLRTIQLAGLAGGAALVVGLTLLVVPGRRIGAATRTGFERE
jgi:hypothetical protein